MDFLAAFRSRRWRRPCAVAALASAAVLPSQAQTIPTDWPIPGWRFCSQQYQTCAFTGTGKVRYGTPTAYVVRTVTGPVSCSNATFGDPAVGVAKACWTEAALPEGGATGVYLGAGCTGRDRLPAYEQWLGRRVEHVVDSLAAESWAAMISTTQWIAGCWQPTRLGLTLSIPMLPNDPSTSLAEGATGAYDVHYRSIGQALVERGYANAVIRIGAEFNGTWFRWTSLNDPVSWVRYWRSAVNAMRSVPGQRFAFDWNVAVGVGASSPEPAYPGDAYVDVISADVYNVSFRQTPQPELWNMLFNAPVGLKWHATFADAHHKPMAFTEWATGTRPDGFGGGDDPFFIESMAQWMKSNRVLYHHYWEYPASDYNGVLSDGSKPKAAAAYRQAFGGPRR